MKKLIVFALFLNAALLAGRFWQELQAEASGGGEEKVANENGDVNGDQDIDVSDPIYLVK